MIYRPKGPNIVQSQPIRFSFTAVLNHFDGIFSLRKKKLSRLFKFNFSVQITEQTEVKTKQRRQLLNTYQSVSNTYSATLVREMTSWYHGKHYSAVRYEPRGLFRTPRSLIGLVWGRLAVKVCHNVFRATSRSTTTDWGRLSETQPRRVWLSPWTRLDPNRQELRSEDVLGVFFDNNSAQFWTIICFRSSTSVLG